VVGAAAVKERALLVGLLQSIRESKLRPGARLPVERDQMVEFGVSRTTVRRALLRLEEAGLIERRQGSGTYLKVHPTEAMVKQIIGSDDRLSRVGRRLVTQRAHRIAVLHDHAPTDPVFKNILAGVLAYSEKRGHSISVGPSRPPWKGESPSDFAAEVYKPNADGVILAATFRPRDQQLLLRIPVPYVLLTDQPAPNALGLDIYAACRQGIAELMNLGHRHIAVIEKHNPNKRAALGHVCDYLREEWSLPGLAYAFGENPLDEVLAAENRPQGLLVKDDVYCRNACAQLAARGLVIGRDIDVITFANRGLDAGLPPAVGRIEFDLEELGRLAAQSIERRLNENGPGSPPVRVGGRYFAPKSMSVSNT